MNTTTSLTSPLNDVVRASQGRDAYLSNEPIEPGPKAGDHYRNGAEFRLAR